MHNRKILKQKSEFCFDVIVKAGDKAQKMMPDKRELTYKTIADYVTDADLAVENLITDEIKKKYPNHGILTEEENSHKSNSPFLWIIDPIDGTINYTIGIPFYCVSIALAHKERVVLGAIYDPSNKELFTAIRGNGAFLNNKEINVSNQKNLKKATVATEKPPQRVERHSFLTKKVMGNVGNLRFLGSVCLDLAYLACGRVDLSYNVGTNPWDIAAGSLLVEEAGGKVRSLEGGDEKFNSLKSNNIVCGNQGILDNYLKNYKKN